MGQPFCLSYVERTKNRRSKNQKNLKEAKLEAWDAMVLIFYLKSICLSAGRVLGSSVLEIFSKRKGVRCFSRHQTPFCFHGWFIFL